MLPLKSVKSAMVLFLVLTSVLMTVSFSPNAKASTSIISMTPTSGEVGSTVYLQANITTTDGPFEVHFGDVVRASGTSVGIYVNTSFTVPEATAGNYSVMIIDVNAGENATANFTVTSAYGLKAEVPAAPKQLQEGDSLSINANITGGDATTTYSVNITVVTPNSASYTAQTTILTSSVGTGNTVLTYPQGFSTNANTNFTGTYYVYFNGTLATEAFFIGLTNSSQYHRSQAIDVKAMYSPNESVTIAIGGTTIYNSTIVEADSNGVVHYVDSSTLSVAPIGDYTVTVTSLTNPNKKAAAPDTQTFKVPGYNVNITTVNLAGEPVPSMIFQVTENNESVTEQTSNSQGLVPLALESGTYDCNATYNDVVVGQQTLVVAGDSLLDFSCNLTSLNVIAIDEHGTRLPRVTVYISPENQTLTTDINGTALLGTMLSGVTSILNISRYGMLFNTTTIEPFPLEVWYNLTVICPSMALKINVTDAYGRPLNNAYVKAQEQLGGLYYSGTTVNGIADLSCPFGEYNITVYMNNVDLNETTVALNATSVVLPITCDSYGFDVSVRAVDYFGQPIPNVNITLQRSEWQDSSIAGGNGLAAFSDTFGGDLNVTVRLAGQSEPSVVTTVSVNNSTTIDVQIGRYTMLAGMMIETSQLLAIIIVVVAFVLVLSVELFRRMRHRTKETKA